MSLRYSDGWGYRRYLEEQFRKGPVLTRLALGMWLILVVLSGCSGGGGATTPQGGGDGGGTITSDVALGVAYGDGYAGETFMPYIREAGAKLSLIKLNWKEMEPNPPQNGQHTYDFEVLDGFLNQLQSGDVVLINIFTNASWATDNAPDLGGPLKLDADCLPYGMTCSQAYRDLVSTIVQRAQGKVKYWQRDTEPASGNRQFPADQSDAYVDLQRYFYTAVKQAMPEAVVVGGSHNGYFEAGTPQGMSFFKYFISQAKDYFDVFDVRFYDDKYSIPARVAWFENEMQSNGYSKPVISTENGGPTPGEFPDQYNFVKDWCASNNYTNYTDPQVLLGCKDAMKAAGQLPLEIEMFFQDDSTLVDKAERLHCRDITQRALILLDSDVRQQWKWELGEWQSPYGWYGSPAFGSLRLMNHLNVDVWEKRPSFSCYQRMAGKMTEIQSVQRLDVGNESIFLYEVIRGGAQNKMYVAWERRDLFSGEDRPTVRFDFPIEYTTAAVTDVFGNQGTRTAVDGVLTLDISDTPVFVEAP
ncbi:MAG: hypothetical protein HZA19_06885 [Nitrospirae bacterium]|nr:hypothetical protein [Nitrospirota bacterium]